MSAFGPKRTSGVGYAPKAQEGASGKVSSSSLGTFMTEAGHFSPETVRNMQVALDLAWNSLSREQQSQSSKMEVATRILNAAEAGERSPARFLMLALLSAPLALSGHLFLHRICPLGVKRTRRTSHI
jgi:hypothetical protein